MDAENADRPMMRSEAERSVRLSARKDHVPHGTSMRPRKEKEERTCPCGKVFEVNKPWHLFHAPSCKDAFRRENEEIGARYRTTGPKLHELHSRLGSIVAEVAAQQPLLGDAVAKIAALHVDLGEALRSVRGDAGARARDGQDFGAAPRAQISAEKSLPPSSATLP